MSECKIPLHYNREEQKVGQEEMDILHPGILGWTIPATPNDQAL